MKKGLAVLGFLQPLLGVGQEAISISSGLVQEMLRRPFRLFPAKAGLGGPTMEGILWHATEMISIASWCTLAKISLVDALAPTRTSSALSATLARISSASFLACSRHSPAR
jgi:hypothetical protein